MPQKFVNLENLTSFWGNAKEYIGNERKEIEDQLYNWQKTEKASVVQCEPVPNSELHPVVDFMFKEILPVSGEKGPSNLSTITGINSVKVTRCGSNCLPILGQGTIGSGSLGGVSYTRNGDGTYTFSGTASSNANTSGNALMSWDLLARGFPKGSYTIGFVENSANVNIMLRIVKNGVTSYPHATGGSLYSFTIDDDTTDAFIYFQFINGATYSETVTPYLCVGSETVDGPCVSNAYTIQFDGTYYGGSIDLSTGLMTVTHWILELDGTEWWSNSNGEIPAYNSTTGLGYSYCVPSDNNGELQTVAGNAVCTHFNYEPTNFNPATVRDGTITSPCVCLVGNGTQLRFAFPFSTLAAWKQWLADQKTAGTPVRATVKLKTPFTVQLTSQQIKSLPSLEGTSKRINTLYTDADSIQVEYQKYIGVDSTLDNTSENAIQNKVVNSALNTKVSLTGDEVIAGSKTFSSPINGSVTGDAGTVAGHIVSKDVPVNATFTDTTYDPATQSTAGLMSASDKVKLDAVGSIFSFKGSVVNSSSLPASDNVNGDAYLAEDTGHVHVYDGTNFVDIGVWAGIPSATDAQIDALFED